ncbi:restriction endonuclease [Cohnella laeviribosi]|uniref:restriction endonuclease n=1 Tax=Cohnella laeviribosi TaxID=380174 RepID=UPI000364DB13|nr:restriction endonuclease [Cohnella laeviribosi]
MARTYYSEGWQIANFLRGLFGILGLVLYFYIIPGLHWSFLIIFPLTAILATEILGALWTRNKRKSAKNTKASARPSTKQKALAPAKQHTVSKTKRKLTDAEIIDADIDTDFERLMEMYYKDKGYTVERVGGSGNHEVDLILKGKEGYKIAVQCKRWKQDVGNDIVLRLKAGKQIYGCYDAWIILTSNFTKAAREAAESLRIRLINGLTVHDMISRWRKERIVEVTRAK